MTEKFEKATRGFNVHPRHPGIAAELCAGYRPFLRFAVEHDVLSPLTAEAYAQAIESHLLSLLLEQGDAQKESSPAHRFIALLRSGLRSKRFHLLDANSDNAPKDYAGACGWHRDWLYQGKDLGQGLDWCVPANSKSIGFIDEQDGHVYLGREEVKTVATLMSRDQAERYENPTKIGRDLAEAGLLRTSTEKGPDGKPKVRHQVMKRVKDHGNERYYAIPIARLFEMGEGEPRSVSTVSTRQNEVETNSDDITHY
jgi:hypothetical protein